MSVRRSHIDLNIASLFSSKEILKKLKYMHTINEETGGGNEVQMIRYVEKKTSQFLQGVSPFISCF